MVKPINSALVGILVGEDKLDIWEPVDVIAGEVGERPGRGF